MSKNHAVTEGIIRQATGQHRLYKILDAKGGGTLIKLMKMANKTRDFSDVDRWIEIHLVPMMYDKGRGRVVHIRELVKARMRDRGRTLGRAVSSGGQKRALGLTEMDHLTTAQCEWFGTPGSPRVLKSPGQDSMII